MKKALAVGAASLALVAMPTFSAFAVDPIEPTVFDVKVNHVDEPIYSVDIQYNNGGMSFDWKYDSESDDFGFVVSTMCGYVQPELWSQLQGQNNLYSDANCTTPKNDTPTTGTDYYALGRDHLSGSIIINDFSQFGKVDASVAFTPATGYDWVDGKFGLYGEGDGSFNSTDYSTFTEFTSSKLPASESPDASGIPGQTIRSFYAQLKLEKNSKYDSSKVVKAGDKIGSVTVYIAPYSE